MLIIRKLELDKRKMCMTLENDSVQVMKVWMDTEYKYTFPVYILHDLH